MSALWKDETKEFVWVAPVWEGCNCHKDTASWETCHFYLNKVKRIQNRLDGAASGRRIRLYRQMSIA